MYLSYGYAYKPVSVANYYFRGAICLNSGPLWWEKYKLHFSSHKGSTVQLAWLVKCLTERLCNFRPKMSGLSRTKKIGRSD